MDGKGFSGSCGTRHSLACTVRPATRTAGCAGLHNRRSIRRRRGGSIFSNVPRAMSKGNNDNDSNSNVDGSRPLESPPRSSSISRSCPPAPDPYRAAGQRLQNLLSGVGDGEEELFNSLLMEEAGESKVVVALIAGLAVSAGAVFVCWLCGLDPLGGASLSIGSLHAAAIGGAVALPLVALKAGMWSEWAIEHLPFLEEVHQSQMNEFQPLLYRLSTVQTLIVVGSEVIPGLLILLPAATGGIAKTIQVYCSLAGIEPPQSIPQAIALGIAALLAAFAKILELGPSSEEFETVKNSLDNADRFYRVVGVGKDTEAKDTKRSADAFKNVAITWLARKQVAARFAAALAATEVIFLGILWHVTGDFSAPLTAGVALAAVDFAFIKRRMPTTVSETNQGPSAS